MSLPLKPVMLPVVCRLSPRIPGYVITVCEETRTESRERHVVALSKECDLSIMEIEMDKGR